MNPDKDRFDLQIRLSAIEYCIARIGHSQLIAASGSPQVALRYARVLKDAMLSEVGEQGIPGFDAAMSDHVSDEMRVHVDRILSALVELSEKVAASAECR